MYFSEHKFAVEVDEKGHTDRNQTKRQTKKQKNILTANFFTRLVLMQRVFIFLLKLVKYRITLLNQIKKNYKKEKSEIKELKEKLEKLEAQIKEPKTKNKELKNLTTNEFTNNSGKITIKH